MRDPLELLLSAALGAFFVVAGYAAASRTRPAIDNHGPRRMRLFLLACGTGVPLGVINLLGNRATAQLDLLAMGSAACDRLSHDHERHASGAAGLAVRGRASAAVNGRGPEAWR